MARPVQHSPDHILAAAERAFSRHGYGATSLRQLMAAAQMSTTAFYARFASKEAVLIALTERLVGAIHQAASRALPDVASVNQGIETAVSILVTELGKHRRLVGLILTEGAASPPVRRTLSRSYELLVALAAAHLPHPASQDPRDLAWATVGALHMQLVRWAVFRDLDDDALAGALTSAARAVHPRPRPPARRS